MKRIIISLLILVIALLGVILAVLNADSVAVDFYFTRVQLPLALVLYIALALGALAGILLSVLMVLRARAESRRLRKRLSVCEQEIKNLREIPIKGQL